MKEPDNSKAMRIASTVLLLRDSADGMEIFMVQRHHEIETLSGALVFPGGSAEPGDREIALNPTLMGEGSALDLDAASIRVGGIRETFEESGILLARPRGSKALISAAQLASVAPERAALDEGEVAFADILQRHELTLAIDMLVPFAHWITPVNIPKRFDTHFLLAIAPADQIGSHDGRESVDSIWLSPKTALDGAASGRFSLPFPTVRNLIKLDRLRTATAAMDHAKATPIVTVTPQMSKNENGGYRLRIPIEAAYDGDVFDV